VLPGSFVDGTRLLYERTRTNNEIDFVGPDLGVPFESKYVDRNWKSESATMRAQYESGVIATRSIFDVEDAAVWAVPVSMIAWLV
jgi:hypothetical protein